MLKFFPSKKQKFLKTSKSVFIKITAFFFSFYFKKSIFLSFDPKIFKSKRIILVSNHITLFDWFFILLILDRFDLTTETYFTMKYELRNLPILGSLLESFGNVFLKRNWNEDKEILEEKMKILKSENNFLVVIFPEGTFLDEEGTISLENYLRDKENIEMPKFTLLPRKKGFQVLYENLYDEIDCIIDLTLISKPFVQFPADFFSFSQVFLDQQCMKLCIVLDIFEKADKNFLNEIFQRKERMLENFSKKEEEFTLSEFAKNLYSFERKNYFYQLIEFEKWEGFVCYVTFLFFIAFLIIMFKFLFLRWNGLFIFF